MSKLVKIGGSYFLRIPMDAVKNYNWKNKDFSYFLSSDQIVFQIINNHVDDSIDCGRLSQLLGVSVFDAASFALCFYNKIIDEEFTKNICSHINKYKISRDRKYEAFKLFLRGKNSPTLDKLKILAEQILSTNE